MADYMTVVMSFADGTEVWYEVDKLTITPDPFGVGSLASSVIPGAPVRPDGPYVEMRGARLCRIAGVPV